MKILTSEQMRRIDERARVQFGLPSTTLMNNAGRAVADALFALYPTLPTMHPLILCGKGDNGGDGIAAARHLASRGITARVVLLARKETLSPAAVSQLAEAGNAGISVQEADDDAAWSEVAATLPRHGLIVDALLGTGLKGAARGLYARAITDVNGCGSEVVAVDIPSGLSGSHSNLLGPAIRAEHTIALACPKVAHIFPPAADFVGRLHMVDIGIPMEAIAAEKAALNLIVEDEVAALLPPRDPVSHKGDYGRLLVIGGSTGKSGAAAMTCLGALRSGVGVVTAATSASAQPILAAHVMEIMTEGLPETKHGALSQGATSRLRELEQHADVLVVGPGLTTDEETAALVREIVCGTPLPVVLDADGLNAFAGLASELRGDDRVLILTPHPGEMARLMSRTGEPAVTPADVQSDRVGAARAFAEDHSCYVVLKGNSTLVAEPQGQVWVCATGNPGMATAGVGDVLTGVIAALLGQGLSPLEACVLGVHVHGLAGDLAAADRGEISLMARDMIEFLPEAFAQIDRAAP